MPLHTHPKTRGPPTTHSVLQPSLPPPFWLRPSRKQLWDPH